MYVPANTAVICLLSSLPIVSTLFAPSHSMLQEEVACTGLVKIDHHFWQNFIHDYNIIYFLQIQLPHFLKILYIYLGFCIAPFTSHIPFFSWHFCPILGQWHWYSVHYYTCVKLPSFITMPVPTPMTVEVLRNRTTLTPYFPNICNPELADPILFPIRVVDPFSLKVHNSPPKLSSSILGLFQLLEISILFLLIFGLVKCKLGSLAL